MLNPKLRYILACFRAYERQPGLATQRLVLELKEAFYKELQTEHPLSADNVYALLLELMKMQTTAALEAVYPFLKDGYVELVNKSFNIRDLNDRTLVQLCAQFASAKNISLLCQYFPRLAILLKENNYAEGKASVLQARMSSSKLIPAEDAKVLCELLGLETLGEGAQEEAAEQSILDIVKHLSNCLGCSYLHTIVYTLALPLSAEDRMSLKQAFQEELKALESAASLLNLKGTSGENLLAAVVELGDIEYVNEVLSVDRTGVFLKRVFEAPDPVVVAALNVQRSSEGVFFADIDALEAMQIKAIKAQSPIDYQDRLGPLLSIPEIANVAQKAAGRSLKEFKPRFVQDMFTLAKEEESRRASCCAREAENSVSVEDRRVKSTLASS